jgi:antitoxin component of MazEF toxin-antitoxin module
MGETTFIRKIGNSLGMLFDKSILEKVYALKPGDEVEVEYQFDKIIVKLKAKPKVEAQA